MEYVNVGIDYVLHDVHARYIFPETITAHYKPTTAIYRAQRQVQRIQGLFQQTVVRQIRYADIGNSHKQQR
jgi:hypothetical protein